MANTVELTLLANDKASSVVNGVSGAVRSLIGQFMAMAGLTAGAAGIGALIKQGIDFNKTMEDSKGGIAGVLLMTRQYVDATGKVVAGQGAMNAAFAEASTIQEKLKKDALGTAASYTELVGAFQTALAPAAAAGVTNLDDVREITVMATQAMAALNIPTAQAAQELRGLFAGDAGPDNRLNQILRVTKAEIAAVAGDTAKAAALFKERLGPAASAAAMQTGTLTVRLSNLGDILDQTMGEATAGLFKEISSAISDLMGGVSASGGKVKAMGADIAKAFTSIMALVKEMSPAILDLVGALAEQLPKIGDALALAALPLKAALTIVTKLIEYTDGWVLVLWGAHKAIVAIGKAYEIVGAQATLTAGWTKATELGAAAMVGLEKTIAGVSLAGTAVAGSFSAMTGELTAFGIVALDASLMVGALFAGLAADIVGIIVSIKLAIDLFKEYKKEKATDQNEAQAMLGRLPSMVERMRGTDLTDPAMQEAYQRIGTVSKLITADMENLGRVTPIVRDEYRKLAMDVAALAPPMQQVTSLAKPMAAEMRAALDAYLALSASLKQKAELSGLDGIKLKLREIQIAAETAATEVVKKAKAAAMSAAGDLANIAKVAADETMKALQAFAKSMFPEASHAPLWDGVLKKLPDQVKIFRVAAEDAKDAMEELDRAWAKLLKEDAGLGAIAGWTAAIAAIPGAGESAARAMNDIWRAMGQGFDSLFASVFTGKLDSLGDVFRNFADQMAGTFATLISDMLQRWIGGTESIAKGWENLNKSMLNENGNLSTGGALMAAGTGYGIGSMVGQGTQANQIGAAVGAVIGAIVLSAIPVVGTILGAIVGGMIGELFNKNTLMHSTGSIGGMVGATRYDQVPIYEKFTGGLGSIRGGALGQTTSEDAAANVAPPGIIGYETVSSVETARSGMELAGKRLFDNLSASLVGIFKTGGADAKGLLDIYRAQLKGDLSGANFDINAGSDETIQKTADYLFSALLPRLGLSAAFGQTGFLPVGNQDKGGVGNLSYGVAGMNADGTWMKKQLFDPEAAIPTMLRGLGFTQDKIGELAARISTDDPKKLLDYITGIVGVVVGLRDLGNEMGKTFADLAKGWAEEVAAGPAAAFGKTATDLAGLFSDLDLYSGDEQLQKAQEAQAASAQFWESVQSYLQQLDALGQKLSAGLQGMREKMRAFLNPLSEAGAGAANQATIDGVWGKLLTATNPGQIESATNEAAAAIEALFNVLAERVTRGKALIERLTKLDQGLWDLGKGTADGPLAAMAQDMVDIQRKVSDAARLTGLEQIAAMEDVAGSAEDMAGKLRSLFSEIASVSESINKSIDSQIWELGVGEMDPTGQATAITQRIKELQDQLQLATSPAEIQAITSEIQSLTGRYVGQFGKDDPNRADAIAWAQEELERTRGLANETLELMRAQAEAYAEELQDLIKGSVTTISTNVDEASAAIGQLSQTLSELDRVVREQLERLGTAALDALEPLRTAMEGAAGIFTGATGAAAEGLTGEPGFNASTDRAAARLEIFANVVDRAAANLERLANAGTGKSTAPAAAIVTATAPESRVSAREVVPILRRYSGALTPRVA